MTVPTSAPRVLFVCHYYPPHIGGIENVVHREALGLRARGAEVTVLSSGRRSRATVQDGVRVVRVAAWNGLEHRAGVPFPLFSPQLLAEAVRWGRWADLIHVHDALYLSSWAALAAARLTGTPYLITQHVGVVQHPVALVRGVQRVVYAGPGRALWRGAERVFTLNSSVAAFTAHGGARPGRAVHLPNGVDTELFRPARSREEQLRARRAHGLPLDRPLVLFVGRLVPKKGYDLLLAAHAAQPRPDYDLVLVGDDCATLPAREGLHVLGRLPHEALPQVYRACDMFALPSVAEGFPLAVQEAMATGLAVLTTDDPGYAAYRLGSARIRLLPRRTDQWAAALRELARDEEQRSLLGAAARAYTLRNFSWDEHVSTLLGHYQELLAAVDTEADDG